MIENTPYKPDAEDFLEMWRHFNQMAHESNVVSSAMKRFGTDGSAWLNYYLYFNHFQAIGQTLLVYCLREVLDVAATHDFSEFDLTGYAMEPEEACQVENDDFVRQALMEEDIFQFASVKDFKELVRILPELIVAEGALKVLVLPELMKEDYKLYKFEIDRYLEAASLRSDDAFIVLTPKLTIPDNQVEWIYWVYRKDEVYQPALLENVTES
jgi:hypothetical protein